MVAARNKNHGSQEDPKGVWPYLGSIHGIPYRDSTMDAPDLRLAGSIDRSSRRLWGPLGLQ